MPTDHTIMTAILDSRYLAGTRELYQDYHRRTLYLAEGSLLDGYLKNRLLDREIRLKKYEDSRCVLEPNIKEGPGGLRDIHEIRWISQAKFGTSDFDYLIRERIFLEEDRQEILKALEFYWKIRNHLHFLAGRKADVLFVDIQTEVARFLGYKDTPSSLAVEEFMEQYHRQSRKIAEVTSIFMRKVCKRKSRARSWLSQFRNKSLHNGFAINNGNLFPDKGHKNIFEKDPEKLMEVFVIAQKTNTIPTDNTLRQIRVNLLLVHESFRSSDRVKKLFLSLFESGKNLYQILRAMQSSGFLEKIIPEFKRIDCRVQFDLYHHYTVDEHTLIALRNLEELSESEDPNLKPLVEIFNHVKKPAILRFGILLHDIGKFVKENHSQVGADVAKDIMIRLGATEEDADGVEFLVREHLSMSKLATRRDIYDNEVITRFAEGLGSLDNLRMLYLLTYADVRAVGPNIWTSWNSSLLQELYVLTKRKFEVDSGETQETSITDTLLKQLQSYYDETKLRYHFEGMPPSYFYRTSADVILEHLRLVDTLGEDIFKTWYIPDPKVGYILTLCTKDRPGLFADITDCLATNGINILKAEIYTRKDGVVLDALWISDVFPDEPPSPNKVKRFEENLTSVLTGVRGTETLFKPGSLPYPSKRPQSLQIPTEIRFDNKASSNHTILEVITEDRLGVLYTIARTLATLGLDIYLAKINTEANRVIDVFYITDVKGQKITNNFRLYDIRTELEKNLA
jgi:[protein-PII] uridylyltransferase